MTQPDRAASVAPQGRRPRRRTRFSRIFTLPVVVVGVLLLVVAALFWGNLRGDGRVDAPPSESPGNPRVSEGRGGVGFDPETVIPRFTSEEKVAEILTDSLANGEDAVAIAAIDWLLEHDDRAAPGDRFQQHRAVALNRTAVLEHMIEHNVGLRERDGEGRLPLHAAARHNRPEVVRLLIDRAEVGVDVPSDLDRATPLLVAARFNSVEAMQALLERGASVDALNAGGMTALHAAAVNGHGRCVDVLLRAGADPARLYQGKDAASLAAENGHAEVAALIRARSSPGGAPRRPAADSGAPGRHTAGDAGRSDRNLARGSAA